jgi:hypothetical protein
VTWRQQLPIGLTVLSYARDFIGIEEIGNNRGPAVEWFQRRGEIGPGEPWCAAFVNGVCEVGCICHNVVSPFEAVSLQGYVQSYYQYASHHGWLIPFEDIFPGAVFLKWFGPPKNRYAHMGFVDTPMPANEQFRTVEGNSNEDGSAEGYKVARNWRYKGEEYVFIDWTKGVRNAA